MLARFLQVPLLLVEYPGWLKPGFGAGLHITRRNSGRYGMRSGRGGNGPSTVQQNVSGRFVGEVMTRGHGVASGEAPHLDFLAAGILAQGARVDAIFAAARDRVATPRSSRCARCF